MRLGLRAVDVVQVVRGDQRQADLRGEAEELLGQAPLLGQAVVLDLEEEVPGAEDVAVRAGQASSRLPVLDLERPGDLAVEAGAEADQALGVLREVVPVDARLVVVAVEVRVGDDAAEVPIARPVLGQEDQVEGLGVRLALAVGHGPPGDVRLDADDRLDAALLAGLVERDRAVEGAVVGQGEAVEAERAGLADEVVDPPQPVEQAELRVDVQVGEVVRGDGHGRNRILIAGGRLTSAHRPRRLRGTRQTRGEVSA